MKVNQYQKLALTTAVYDDSLKVRYPSIGLCGEAGEVCEKIKKLFRDADWKESDDVPEDKAKLIALELGDVMWYGAVLSHDCGFTLSDILFTTGEDIAFAYIDCDFTEDIIESAVKLSLFCGCVANDALNNNYPSVCDGIKYIFSQIDTIASYINFTLSEIATMNIQKLESRQKRDKIKGNGDER